MTPHTGISRHLSHCDNNGKREKKGGVVGGKQKLRKVLMLKNNCLKKKQRLHNTLPRVVPIRCYTETA